MIKIAESNLGFKHSEKTKLKMSKNSAKNNLGKPLSEETKQKLREINKGKKHTEETKKKMSLTRKGKKKPEWQKEKSRGENNKNVKLTEKEVIKIKKRLNNKIKLKEIAEEFNISLSQIYRIKIGEHWGWVKISSEKMRNENCE